MKNWRRVLITATVILLLELYSQEIVVADQKGAGGSLTESVIPQSAIQKEAVSVSSGWVERSEANPNNQILLK
mgnify:FL=1